MSNCLQCGEPTPPSKRTKKSLMYCSKLCANRYLHKTKRYGLKPEGWIRKSENVKQRREERRALLNPDDRECSICETKANAFTFSEDTCDTCHKVVQSTTQDAKRRRELERLVQIVEDDEEMELVDLPAHIRRRILESGDFSFTSRDLARGKQKDKIYAALGDDPACRSSQPEGDFVGAVYALYFPDEPGLEKLVYVGLSIGGVMNRFKGHLSDARTRKKNSTGNATYKSLLKRLQKENKQTSIRVQLLENFGYDSEVGEEKLTHKERITLLELLEQKWQMRFFLSGFELLNASFKICTKSPLFQRIIREDLASFDPDLHGIKDISKVGLGCYVGREYRAGYAWNFVPFTEQELKDFPYTGGTEIPELEQDSEEEDTKTEEESEPHLFVRQYGSVRPKERELERLTEELAKYKGMLDKTVAEATGGLLTAEEFANACGTKRPPLTIEPTFKSPWWGCGNYYHPDKVEEYKVYKQNNPGTTRIENPEFGRAPCGNVRRIPLRQKSLAESYVEKRLLLGARNYDTYGVAKQRQVDKFKAAADAWKANGYTNPRTKQCSACATAKPFYDYYPDTRKCKACVAPRDKQTVADPAKDLKPKSVRRRIATAFVVAIKQSLSKGSKEYNSTPTAIIWDEVEKHLGYNKEDLLKHLESNFEPWMDWTCWGRTRKNKEGKYWKINYATARSTYAYTGINTPEFKEIWNLDNISPLLG